MLSARLMYAWLTVTTLSLCSVMSYGVTEWLNSGSTLEFDSKEVPHIGLLNRLHWIEKNERSTSRNYTFWEEADVYLLEWPGNITQFDPDNPFVKWGQRRAKYLEDICGLEYTGIEMRVYAYNYVYLTWGPNRLTSTSTSPLTVPRSIIPGITLARLSRNHSYEENELNTVVVYDFAFTFDTLLLAYSDGVIRVSGLEMAWAEVSKTPKRKLKYSTSRGVKGPVDKIIAQNCCTKTDFCPFGNMVVAYKENSKPYMVYTSTDGGVSFQRIKPEMPQIGSLKLVLSFPEYGRLIVFHGSDKSITMDQINFPAEAVQYLNSEMANSITFLVNGHLKGSRIGMETSFIVWDKCSVWYSPDIGYNITRSLLYIHKKIRKNEGRGLHLITSQYCSFGEDSAFAYGNSGKFVLLDKRNTLFMGIDGKTSLSQMVAYKMDMSLLLPGKEFAVTPTIEYTSDQPKLMYPPRYLELPKAFKLGRSYDRRLGMRILPKNVYPSDYILSFYDENVKGFKGNKEFMLQVCQTSSLQVNRSITQKRKLYHVTPWTSLNFTVGFTSRIRKIRQLNFEPEEVLKYLSVKIFPESIDTIENEDPQYFMKYRVLIRSKTDSSLSKLFRLNFYTKQDLRCIHQPRVTVFIMLGNDPNASSEHLSDEDMSKSVYLKSVTAGETTYLDKGMDLGETFKVETCPYKK